MHKISRENCGSTKFGLVRQRWFRFQFCSKACKTDFLASRKRELERTIRWLRNIREARHEVPAQSNFARDIIGRQPLLKGGNLPGGVGGPLGKPLAMTAFENRPKNSAGSLPNVGSRIPSQKRL